MMNNSSQPNCYFVFYPDHSLYILGIALPFVILFGLVANALSIAIFLNPKMRSSKINWYFMTRSVTDALLLLTSFFLFALPRIGQLTKSFAAINVSHFATPLIYGLVVIAQTASIYLTVIMTTHRFIGVCLPFKSVTILTGGRVKALIIGVLLFSLLFNVTKFFEFYVSHYCMPQNVDHMIYMVFPTNIRYSKVYKTIFLGWFATLIKFLIPFSTLILMNGKIIHTIHRSQQFHYRLSQSAHAEPRPESRVSEGGRSILNVSKEVNTSVTLVGVVVVFLVCNTLSLILNVIEVSGYRRKMLSSFQIITDVSILLVAMSCSINIFVYCFFSEKYSVLLKYYLCGARLIRLDEEHVLRSLVMSSHEPAIGMNHGCLSDNNNV